MAMTAFPPPPNGTAMDRSGSLSLSDAVAMADGGEVNPTRIGRSRSSVRLIGPEIAGPDSGAGGQANNIAQPKRRVRRHSSINYQAQRAQQMGMAAPIQQNPSMRVMPGAPPQQQQQKQHMMRPGTGMAPPAAMAAPAPTGAVMPQQMMALPQHQHRQQLPPAMQPQPLQRTVEEEQQPQDSPPKKVFLSGPPPGGAAPRRAASQRRLSETTASMSTTFPRPCPPSRSRSGKPSTREAEPQSVRKSSPSKSSSRGGASESPDLKPRSRAASPTVESDPTPAPKAKRTTSFFRPETPPRRRRAAAKVNEEKNENSGAMQKLSSFFFGKPRSAARERPVLHDRPTSRSERPASRSRRRSNGSSVKQLSGIEEVPHREGRVDEIEVEELEEVLYQRDLKRMDSVFRTKSFRGNFSDNDDDDDDDDGDNSQGWRSALAQAEDSPRSSSPRSNSESPAYAGSVFAEDTPTSSGEQRNARNGGAARARPASADSRNSGRSSNSSSTSSDSDYDTGFSASGANTSQYSMLQDPDYGAPAVEEARSASPAAELSESGYYFEPTASLSVPAAVPSRRNSDAECRLPPTRFSPPSQHMLAFSAPHMTVMPPLQLQQQQPQQQRLFSVPLPGQQGFPMMPNQQRHGTLPYAVPSQPIGMQAPYLPQPQQQYAQAAAPARSGQSSPVSVFNQQAEQARQRSCMPGMNTMYMRRVPVGMANFMPGPMQGPYPMQ